jgi:hypothetical protein
VRDSKDAALAIAARAFLNRRFSGIGTVDLLTIDTAAQSVELQLALSGETEPVRLDIRRYLLHMSNEAATVTIVDATASRPWLDKGLQTFIVGQPWAIPSTAAFALKWLS